jgi:hypothetical protein
MSNGGLQPRWPATPGPFTEPSGVRFDATQLPEVKQAVGLAVEDCVQELARVRAVALELLEEWHQAIMWGRELTSEEYSPKLAEWKARILGEHHD